MRCSDCKRAMTMTLVGVVSVHSCEECGKSERTWEPSIGQYNMPRHVPMVLPAHMLRGDDPENMGPKVSHACYTKPAYNDKPCSICPATFTPSNGSMIYCYDCRERIPKQVRNKGRPAVLAWLRKHAEDVAKNAATAARHEAAARARQIAEASA